MAKKKKRTPAPPRSRNRPPTQTTSTPQRQVQAPQVRTGKRRTPRDVERRNRYILYALAGSGIVGLVVALIVVLVAGGGGGGGKAANVPDNGPSVNFAAVPGIRRTKAPWSVDSKGLKPRLKPVGLTPLPREALAQHKHAHLDVFVDGKHIIPPRYIGIHLAPPPQFITELHTHDAGTDGQPPASGKLPNQTATGVIHIESPDANATYSLGQFFGVWGVFLSKKCVGGYCAKPGTPLKVYVNGKPFTGNPVTLVLDEHEEIAIVYGTPPSNIPSSYNWGQL